MSFDNLRGYAFNLNLLKNDWITMMDYWKWLKNIAERLNDYWKWTSIIEELTEDNLKWFRDNAKWMVVIVLKWIQKHKSHEALKRSGFGFYETKGHFPSATPWKIPQMFKEVLVGIYTRSGMFLTIGFDICLKGCFLHICNQGEELFNIACVWWTRWGRGFFLSSSSQFL